jgi:hypothetical protein
MAKRQKPVDEPDTAATAGQAHTIITRLIEDADLREAAARALESGHRVHERLNKARKPSKLVDDTELHAEAAAAYEALRTLAAGVAGAAVASRAKAKKRKRRRGRMVLAAIIGAGLALVASEGLRSKVLDALFGAEEEFEYSPPGATPPATDTPSNPLSAV